MGDLNAQITALDVRIKFLNDKAQNAVKAKNRVAALAALKSKKAAETTLTQRFESLSQLHDVYGKIEQASDQVAVIHVMKASTGVLRDLHAQVGGIEKVEDVVEGLREEMNKVDEVNQVMEEAGREGTVVDDDEIDEELNALEQQDRIEKEEKQVEQTRQRFAELDDPKKQVVPADAPAEKPEQQEDPEVVADIKALRRLSLESEITNDGRADQRSQDPLQEATR